MICQTQLLYPSPATHLKAFQVFLIYFPKCPGFSTIKSSAPNVALYQLMLYIRN